MLKYNSYIYNYLYNILFEKLLLSRNFLLDNYNSWIFFVGLNFSMHKLIFCCNDYTSKSVVKMKFFFVLNENIVFKLSVQ